MSTLRSQPTSPFFRSKLRRLKHLATVQKCVKTGKKAVSRPCRRSKKQKPDLKALAPLREEAGTEKPESHAPVDVAPASHIAEAIEDAAAKRSRSSPRIEPAKKPASSEQPICDAAQSCLASPKSKRARCSSKDIQAQRPSAADPHTATAADSVPTPSATQEASSADEAMEDAASGAIKGAKPKAMPRGKSVSECLALSLMAMKVPKAVGKPQPQPERPWAAAAKLKPSPPTTPPPTKAQPSAALPRLDAKAEIDRILNANYCPFATLLLDANGSQPLPEDMVQKAWKRLVLLLHPDKLQRLGDEVREAGAEALQRVHSAKDELQRQQQKATGQVPSAPEAACEPDCSDRESGSRKYMVSWKLPETQDPSRPVDKYEIWGPKYFSESGEPFDWILLATLPPLQSSFVIVEEAPTQQDVMWAADRVLIPTLPLAVHAANGSGSSEACTFDLPWATEFHWLSGDPSAMCQRCLTLNPLQLSYGPTTSCSSCSAQLAMENVMHLRCQECQGSVLWQGTSLNCTCCLKPFGDFQSKASYNSYGSSGNQGLFYSAPRGHHAKSGRPGSPKTRGGRGAGAGQGSHSGQGSSSSWRGKNYGASW
eukprot:TRINITY_DN36300_c0_g1_i1.p1 TRINITY_DN36300_c0_g1~~TRINITY_DN36300_c0_g1_i1.p1  ORF type:complete len:597 (+),score=122.04 TRINITY_DN36300_c0_g1_i1:139-1929(+)